MVRAARIGRVVAVDLALSALPGAVPPSEPGHVDKNPIAEITKRLVNVLCRRFCALKNQRNYYSVFEKEKTTVLTE